VPAYLQDTLLRFCPEGAVGAAAPLFNQARSHPTFPLKQSQTNPINTNDRVFLQGG